MRTEYAPHPRHKCPRCGSPAPHLHPAVQFEGEVQHCSDEYHTIPTNQNVRFLSQATEREAHE